MPQPYVSRPEAEAFLAALADAIKAPQANPVVFHVWGIGGVGKSTLTRKVQETYQGKAKIAAVSFGLTEGIDEPIPLMAKLYAQLAVKDAWNRDPFWEKYDLYFETIHQLNTQAVSGRGEATPEQAGQVKQLLQLGVDVAGELVLSESGKKAATTLVDRGVDAVAAGLALKDSVQQLLQQHKATRRNVELQKLMIEPLPQLTQAFVAGLSQQAQQQPIILLLDTYEKAPTTIDTWLWRTLLGNTNLANSCTRLMVAGRHCIRRTEGWRKLHQDRNAIFDRTIERFDLPQTQDYLTQIGLTDAAQAEKIFQTTKGLPYYLNWVREQTERGQIPDFDQGNEEIVRLLLQGLNDTQKLLVQLAACCRWFDSKVIRYLTEQHSLDFATAADDKQNCFGWLTQLSFVEPTGKHWRLDDVARDIFRQSLEREDLERIHSQLAQYFLALSDQEVNPKGPASEKYDNPEWISLRSDYLYHLLFTRPRELQTVFIAHLLEARCLRQDGLVRTPLQAIVAEFDLSEHPLLRHNTRQFLQRLRPAVEYGWAVLEEDPIDYPYNEAKLGLGKVEIDRAVAACLHNPTQFEGLAKFAALFYKAKRCAEGQKLTWLQQAQDQVEQLATVEPPDFLAELFLDPLGNSFYNASFLEEAINCYDAALAIKPDKHEALYNKGNALSALGRKEDAIACYDAALVIKPDYHEALNNKGNALSALGRKEDAIACYDAALAIKPDKHGALNNKGNALDDLGRKEDAIACYDVALAIKPDNHEALYNKGNALDDLGRKEEAIACYDAALAIKPDKHEALYNKGNALSALGRKEDAIACYDAALAIKPDNHQALNNKGTALSALGQYEDAIKCCDQVLSVNSDYFSAWGIRGMALTGLGRFEEALSSYDKALSIQPDSSYVIYKKACCYGLQCDADNAIQALQSAIALDPKYRDMAKTDTDFDPIHTDEQFQALLNGE